MNLKTMTVGMTDFGAQLPAQGWMAIKQAIADPAQSRQQFGGAHGVDDMTMMVAKGDVQSGLRFVAVFDGHGGDQAMKLCVQSAEACVRRALQQAVQQVSLGPAPVTRATGSRHLLGVEPALPSHPERWAAPAQDLSAGPRI